ncbi:MAG: hypothetical protein JWM53_3004 [bacterium]|nr:hypothetical protein [bacterium]
METLRYVALAGCIAALGCGGTRTGSSDGGAEVDMSPAVGDGPTIIGQHGVVIDYFSNMPLAGFTVTDGQNSATTAADGTFVMPAPMGATLAPSVTGPMYTQLFLPTATVAGVDVDWGAIPIPSSSSFMLEQQIVANDQAKALVQISLVKTGACTAVTGGTLTVNAPAGASVRYFTAQGLPTATAFTEVDASLHKPVAVLYDVPPGAAIDLTINHPTCKVAAQDKPIAGKVLSGAVTTMATEPGDKNSSLVYVLE